MKNILLTLAVLTILSDQTNASDINSIQCYFKNQSSLGVLIKMGQFKGPSQEYYDASATAKIIIAGPQLYTTYTTIIKKKYINTRIASGEEYYSDLGNNSAISLSNIQWASSALYKEGIDSNYIHNGYKIALTCK